MGWIPSSASSTSNRFTAEPWSRVDTLLLLVITAVGGAIRLTRLGIPTEYLWDEFYAQDACFYLHISPTVCGTDQEITWTHPPLGKWLIALGIRAFGYEPFGRRAAAMIVGTIAVAILYVLARKILRSRIGATVAATLLAVDWLHFVQSRIAMLDIFVSTFGLAALLCLAFDRERLLNSATAGSTMGLAALVRRPWRWAAGGLAGAAMAVKWSGGLFLLLILILTLVWEVASRRSSRTQHRWRAAVREEGISIAVTLVMVPAVIYVLSYAGSVHTTPYAGNVQGSLTAWPTTEDSWLKQFARRQVRMARFHRTLVGEHYYASAGWSWPLLKRPTVFFAEVRNGRYREILATGNPLMWWPALAALVWAAFRWARDRHFSEPHGFILMTFAINYIPWVYLSGVRRFGFIYYMLPAVPSMCLAIALVARNLQSTLRGRIAISTAVAATVASFAFFYPVLSAVSIDRSHWDRYMLFRDCQGRTEPGVRAGQPPPGWCWI